MNRVVPRAVSRAGARVVLCVLHVPVMLAAVVAAGLATAPRAEAQARSVEAVRIRGEEPRLDGRLTESFWVRAPAATGLRQREPNEGEPAIENSEVRFAYDDDALYVGARMYSANPADIRALVTRRDQEGISEFIAISLDTYRDRRTAYSFAVTPAGGRIDVYHAGDSDDSDSSFDPVWEARAHIDSLGWTAEMRIPFNQLRFSPRDEQVWGLNVLRRVPARNEDSYWMLIRRQETGWASRMGTLTGIRGIRPSRRLEALPYAAANSRVADVTDVADPFQQRTTSGARAGGDLKVGLGPNLTLDATFNPDFGQVEGDPAEVNLSAYETFFEERRPFFTEGADLFSRRGLFYSRRIGAPPPARAAADFSEERGNSTILGAAKVTGRLPSGLSVAGLGAVTDREVVRTFDAASQSFGRALVAPRTAYAVASAQQELGRDASTLGGMLTFVHRDLDRGTPLADLLARSAVSGIVDGRRRWAGGQYDVNFWLGFTDVRGDSAAILQQQLSSRRYWQRPDAEHVSVDPSRRALTGTFFGVGHSKMAGRHWLWNVDYFQESPAFEPNDIGAFGAVNNRYLAGNVTWRQTQPARWYRDYSVGAGIENQWSYYWLRREREAGAHANVTLANYWEISTDYWYSAPSFSDRLTRGGPIMGTVANHGGEIEIEGREGARTQWGVEYGYARDAASGYWTNVEVNLSARPSDRLELSVEPEWSRERESRQYVMTRGGGRAETFGNRYIFAAVDLSEIAAPLRVNYTFTPNLTLETYAEPFAASGRFHGFGELLAPRSRALLSYGTGGGGTSIIRNADGSYTVTDGADSFTIDNEDFNVRSFRSNVVLRWEWRPGSTLYAVWQQNREGDRPFRAARPGDIFGAFGARGENVLAVKVSYWLALD